jgi:hypothetical protein
VLLPLPVKFFLFFVRTIFVFAKRTFSTADRILAAVLKVLGSSGGTQLSFFFFSGRVQPEKKGEGCGMTTEG